jgi:hypothetical protein
VNVAWTIRMGATPWEFFVTNPKCAPPSCNFDLVLTWWYDKGRQVRGSGGADAVAAQTSEQLLARWRAEPERAFDGIVAVAADPADYVARLEGLNLTVRRRFNLTRTLAVSGPARAFLALNETDWVIRIEEDRPVRTARAAL